MVVPAARRLRGLVRVFSSSDIGFMELSVPSCEKVARIIRAL